ncbi:MAG: DUF4390 domain-containing protein [Thiotrichales bacterium]|nr:DUF4390 domain-containing protein [Thiotrichales bacterium]
MQSRYSSWWLSLSLVLLSAATQANPPVLTQVVSDKEEQTEDSQTDWPISPVQTQIFPNYNPLSYSAPFGLNLDASADSDPIERPPTKPGIRLIKMQDYLEDHRLKVDSISQFTLGDAQIEAINHGIAIKFRTEILLTEQSSFFGIPYQRTRKHVRYLTELSSIGLNRQYLLFNNRNDKLQRFATLERALETMGTLEAFEVAHLKTLHPTQTYRLRVRIYLDFWTLPAPLLVDALLDSTWRLDSDWVELQLTTPLSWQ